MEYIQVDRMNNCNIENANIFMLNKEEAVDINCILTDCKNSIDRLLSNWNGVTRSKKKIETYNQYYRIAKNTFDQQKSSILAEKFWSPLFNLIPKV